MKNLLLFSLIIILAYFECFSQPDFRPGFIITNDFDSIYGLIDYRSESRNANICVFRQDSKSHVNTYNPSDIFGYRFTDDRYYISREVTLEGKSKMYFLEYLFNGIVSIYFFMEAGREYYLIESEDGELHFLTNEEIDRYFEGQGRFRVSTNRYIGQLRYVFSDYPELQKKIDRTKLSHTSLITIANDYHQFICPDEECIIYMKNLPFFRFRFAFFGGMNINSLNFSGYSFFANLGSINSKSPSVGVLMNITLPRVHEKFSVPISYEYGRSYYHQYTESTLDQNSDRNEYHDIHIRSNHSKFSFGIKYTYPTGKLRPSFSAGFLFVKEFSGQIQRVSDFEQGDVIYSQPDVVYPMPWISLGKRLSVGFDFHQWKNIKPFLNLNYDWYSGMIGNQYQSHFNTVFINMGLYIN